MVYLGPSNNTGIGTIWRRIEGGGYELKRLPPDFSPATLNQGNWSSCLSTHPSSFTIGSDAKDLVTFRAGSKIGALAIHLKRAKKVSLKVDAWRQVQFVGDEFTDWFKQLPEEDPYKRSLLKQGRVAG
jgi:hypothetical protein